MWRNYQPLRKNHWRLSSTQRHVLILFLFVQVWRGTGNVVHFFLFLFLTHVLIEYLHVKEAKVVQGHLMQCKCPTLIQIYSPINQSDQHTIVILWGVHKYPMLVQPNSQMMGRTNIKPGPVRQILVRVCLWFLECFNTSVKCVTFPNT